MTAKELVGKLEVLELAVWLEGRQEGSARAQIEFWERIKLAAAQTSGDASEVVAVLKQTAECIDGFDDMLPGTKLFVRRLYNRAQKLLEEE